MDIRDWSLNKIMQLPDCAFGRRWPFSAVGEGTSLLPAFRISLCALPEWCVLWEVVVVSALVTEFRASIELRLGDQLPTTKPEFQTHELLLPCLECLQLNPSRIMGEPGQPTALTRLKFPVRSAGRRLLTQHASNGLTEVESAVYTVWSSIPTEVPDWLCSAIR
ncbi:hypothetical protein ES708_34200 [subsurface metagenome]